jgi:hypothetical protein
LLIDRSSKTSIHRELDPAQSDERRGSLKTFPSSLIVL